MAPAQPSSGSSAPPYSKWYLQFSWQHEADPLLLCTQSCSILYLQADRAPGIRGAAASPGLGQRGWGQQGWEQPLAPQHNPNPSL